MNALSPSTNVPSDVLDARICSVMLTDDSSGVWTTALNLVDVQGESGVVSLSQSLFLWVNKEFDICHG